MDQIKVGVGVIIWNDNKVLLGKRLGAHGHAEWSFPGGHVEFGETPEYAAIREVEEETALLVGKLNKFHFTSDVFDSGRHYITLFFVAESWSGEVINMEPEKCAEWNWFTPENLPQPLFKPIITLLKEVRLAKR
ncbi:NUDIX domain-containing protein [Mucilaginibacter sabulilitoris]|uniref:NUDIX domain-containing protein n=1 Tax=Mucilaginibacter sabulilitoris TaxID=1173583 RepID=A0ABZ0TY69_9SPHI|nr:NUDIX domain-containing protein [Mucilaginibacter sabulilitoris]WPU96070.1 NUDIX domain-containing protein [Mucilaginibacter sabulilitoris]